MKKLSADAKKKGEKAVEKKTDSKKKTANKDKDTRDEKKYVADLSSHRPDVWQFVFTAAGVCA